MQLHKKLELPKINRYHFIYGYRIMQIRKSEYGSEYAYSMLFVTYNLLSYQYHGNRIPIILDIAQYMLIAYFCIIISSKNFKRNILIFGSYNGF